MTISVGLGTVRLESLVRRLDENGDGTGDVNAIGDYSITPATFSIVPPVDRIFLLTEFTHLMTDNGSLNADGYGGINTPLPNGLLINLITNGFQYDLAASPILCNTDLLRLSNDFRIVTFSASKQSLVTRFYPRLDINGRRKPIVLNGSKGDRLDVICQDDFGSIQEQNFTVHGFK